MSEPRALVEHFFCHEFGRLGAVLTRSLGVRRLDLVEDVVQAALVQTRVRNRFLLNSRNGF
jgi:RNA polymerase sigma-70 factor (ECF subfamily)